MTTVPGPAYLTPTYRYANDDWAGANALAYTVYQTDAQGNPTTTPMDLTGFAASGQIYYRPDHLFPVNSRLDRQPMGAPLPGVVGAIVNATAGAISLSVQKANTVIIRQDMVDWYCDVPEGQSVPSGLRSKLIAQPMVVDPSGNLVTVGLQPLYVL